MHSVDLKKPRCLAKIEGTFALQLPLSNIFRGNAFPVCWWIALFPAVLQEILETIYSEYQSMFAHRDR